MQPGKGPKVGTGKIVRYDPNKKKGVIARMQDGKLFLFNVNNLDESLAEADETLQKDEIVQFVEAETESGNPSAERIVLLGGLKSAS